MFADCTPDTWEIDPSVLEAKITEKTKGIIGVHLYGQPFDFVQQLVVQTLQVLLFADLEHFFADDEVYSLFDHRALLVVVLRDIICLLVMLDHSVAVLTEDVDIVIAYQLMDLYVCTVTGTQCYGTV